MKCDAEGNLYVRAYQYPHPGAIPITRISADGKQIEVFGLRNLEEGKIKNANIPDFTVDLRGNVYLLAHVHEQSGDNDYLVRFAPTGKHDAILALQLGFFPAQIAVFKSGEFLITGSNVRGEGAQATGEAVTAIFDQQGRFVKKIAAAGDVKIGPSGPGSKAKSSDAVEPDDPAAAIDLGMSMTGDDGNVYVLRVTSEPFVLVISPAGEVLRRIVLTPPRIGLQLDEIQVGGGKVVGQFQRTDIAPGQKYDDLYLYSVFDAETGERLMDYKPTPQLQGMFACYGANGFTFLSSSQGQLELKRAAVR